MRVYVKYDKTYEELGAVRWTCEWYTLPKGLQCDDDEVDPTAMIGNRTVYSTKQGAVSAAKRRLKSGDDFYGNPTVRKQVVDWSVKEDRIAEWSDVYEPVYIV